MEYTRPMYNFRILLSMGETRTETASGTEYTPSTPVRYGAMINDSASVRGQELSLTDKQIAATIDLNERTRNINTNASFVFDGRKYQVVKTTYKNRHTITIIGEKSDE